MTDLADLGFSVDTIGLLKGERALDKYAKTGEKTERRTEASAKGMGKSYKMLLSVIGAVTTAFASLNKLVSVSREFDVLNAQLITATGSAENAAIAFEAIQNFAATTPYDLSQATKAFTQLVNLGLDPSERALVSYGNTASAMGKSLSQMVEAVADATVGEFERLKEFGIKSKTEGDNISFTFRGITTTVKKEAAAIEGYLSALGENEFAGAMAIRAATLDGAISNLGDTWNSLFLTVSNQGVGESMAEGVRSASDAIQTLDDLISSGSLANSIVAIGGLFDGFVNDVASSFNIASAIIENSAGGWIESVSKFFGTFGEAFTKLPQMVRFAIKSIAVSIASIVDFAKIYGDAFVDIMSLRFKKLAERAKLDGKIIANALNPFSDDNDFTSDIEALTSKFASAEASVLKNAENRADAISRIRDESIMGFALEESASTDLFNKRMEQSNKLLEQYKKEKEVNKGDVLAQFKIIPDKESTDESAIEKAAADYQKWIDKIEKSTGTLDKLQSEIEQVKEAMSLGDLDKSAGLEYLEQLEKKVKGLKKTMSGADLFGSVTDSVKESLGAVQDLSSQGSKEYARLGVAIQAVSAAQAIFAVLNQAGGDPYTAFARMAAMVTTVAALGQSIGGLGGGGGDVSAQNQASQGTNVWGEKSESIANAIEITADATDKLVGINTGMLKALQSMQAGISAAAGLTARGAKGAEFSGGPSIMDPSKFILDPAEMLGMPFLGDFIGKAIGKFLGGSSEVTDKGVKILGGMFSDILDGASVFAFQLTSAKKNIFSSSHDYLSQVFLEEASKQFTLVFQSLADTVKAGGIALGLSGDELEKAINEFTIAETKISLKDLSIEEQQAEIEAVFGEIFDDLAGAVIPFIDEFQKTGEGLGETLARVASQVAIAEFSVKNLGIELGDKLANPQLFAEIADNLSTMTGGIESFAEKISSFVDDFAPDSVKLSIATDALTESLGGVGLAVPDSTEGFWKLMASLDGTTEAGQEQIAALLNIQGVAKDYYDLLEDSASELNNLSKSLVSAANSMFGISAATAKASLDNALIAARTGDFAKALALNTSGLAPQTSDFSSMFDFNVAQSETANKLLELAELTGEQVTTEDMMLTEAQKQTELLTSINNSYVPQKTQDSNNVIMLEEIKALRSEMSESNKNQKKTAENTEKSANHLQWLEVERSTL